MLTEVKKCIESNDIKGLHYIFVDSLDVDPTFEKYKSDYEYCKKINGFFEPYVDMTPFISSEKWNEKYWVQIKMDLMKNFSEKRFSHMREVAKVIYAEKIKRLEQERRKAELHNQQIEKEQREQTTRIEQQKVREATSTNIVKDNNMLAEKEQERIAKERRAIELHNQQVEKEQREQRARIEKARMEQQKVSEAANSAHGNETKKDMGVVAIVAIAAIIAIILVIVLLKAL